ncbi:MAG: C4-dicarboxylate ABC transporter [Eubacterium sp.]|nr:C4-dicarboxylate ABC transporter [Eubacterium sp.]
MQEVHVHKYFAPSWPAFVMGTGGLANILWKWHAAFPVLQYPAIALAAIALIGYVLIMTVQLRRFSAYPEYALRDLHDPIQSNFYVTTGVSTIIVATSICNIWSIWIPEPAVFTVCLILWIIACAIVTWCTFYITLRNFLAREPFPDQSINFAWLMAPIANMAILLIGCPVTGLAMKYAPGAAMTLFTVNSAFFGIGFFLFIFVSAFVYGRFCQGQITPPATTPTFGIFLSAIGLIAGPLHDLANNAVALQVLDSAKTAHLLCLITWGFGIWIMLITLMICLHHARNGGFPFKLSWWAFIFPMGAYTIASLKTMDAFPCVFTTVCSAVFTVFLTVLWIYVFINTIKGILDKSLFLGTPIEL